MKYKLALAVLLTIILSIFAIASSNVTDSTNETDLSEFLDDYIDNSAEVSNLAIAPSEETDNIVTETIPLEVSNIVESIPDEPMIEKESRFEKIDKNKAIIDKQVELEYAGYQCTANEYDEVVIVICDSIYDGNGDGICQSGESCMKFEIDGKDVKKYEKNSKHEFMESDDSFFVDKVKVEVLE